MAIPVFAELAVPDYSELAIPGLPTLTITDYIPIRQEGRHMDRGLELRIKGHLYEIREINDQVLDTRQGFPMAERGYQKTLQSVADCSNLELVDQVANKIKEHIRTREERPSNRAIRRDARLLLADEGIAADNYLNTA